MILYLDCSSGISGDMLVAALLGVAGATPKTPGPLDELVRPALKAAGVDPRLVQLAQVRRGGIAGLVYTVGKANGFASFDELIVAMYASKVAEPVADAVAAVAKRMQAAEREVHAEEEEHLHELAGIDTAADLIAAAVLIHHLAPERIVATAPPLGSGTVETKHGTVSVPAPAVLVLLRDVVTGGGATRDEGIELTTPTGAALYAEFVQEVAPFPAGRIVASANGAGSREVPGRANVLRAVLVEEAEGAAGHRAGEHLLLETNIDDTTPEVLAHAADVLREAGAIDVWTTPALMKKGRPGVVLHVLAPAAELDRLATLVVAETTTFGLRVVPVGRWYADERREKVKIAGKEVGVRLAFAGDRLVTVSPEFEDCATVAAAVGRPVKVVYEAAQAAARKRFSGS